MSVPVSGGGHQRHCRLRRTRQCTTHERGRYRREWEIDAAERRGRREGKIEGQIDGGVRMVRTLQGLLGVAVAEERELRELTLEESRAMTSDLQEKLRSRTPS